MAEIIIQSDINTEHKRAMQRYSIMVNRRRALPDVRDGLKSVDRRILTSMKYDLKILYGRPHIKSARVVGDAMGKYHPHGDSSIYGALVGLAQSFTTKIPLIDPHGNFGNAQGDGAAAMRYTEVRLSEFAELCYFSEFNQFGGVDDELLEKINKKYGNEKNMIDWVDNFDNTTKEPEYFNAMIPILLINGNFGIGLGLTSKVPTHNLGEVIDATIKLIKNPNAEIQLIPDLCSESLIVDTNWKSISNKGNGTFVAKAIVDIENGEEPIIKIKSILDQTVLEDKQGKGILPAIEKLIKAGKLPQVKSAQGTSEKKETGAEIILAKGSDPVYVRDYLYKHTDLMKSYQVNFEVLNGIEMIRLSYKQYLQFFINERRMNKYRKYCNVYKGVKTNWLEKQTYIKVLQSSEIDNIIKMIRKLKDTDQAALSEYLIDKLNVTDIEVKFIINLPLHRLSEGNLMKTIDECNKLEQAVNYYIQLLASEDETVFDEEIIQEMLWFKQRYNTPRKSKLISKSESENIPEGEFKIVYTKGNFIKKISPIDPVNSFKGDHPKFVFNVSNTDNLLLFDKFGKTYKLPVHKIAVCDKNSSGFDIRHIANKITSDIISIIPESVIEKMSKMVNTHYMIIVTANNSIKRVEIADLLNVSIAGTTYSKLGRQDEVVGIQFSPESVHQLPMECIIYSGNKALRIRVTDIPIYKRTAVGVNAMSTKNRISGISLLYPLEDSDILVITESGRINRFPISSLPLSERYKAGSNVIKLSDTDEIFDIIGAAPGSTLNVKLRNEIVSIPVNEIKQSSTISTGQKIIAMKDTSIMNVYMN